MASGAAGVEPVDPRRVRHPLVEGNAVVDVVDVSAADPEVGLDAGWGEREGVGDEVGGAGRKAITDLEQVFDVAVELGVP